MSSTCCQNGLTYVFGPVSKHGSADMGEISKIFEDINVFSKYLEMFEIFDSGFRVNDIGLRSLLLN